MNWNTKDQRLQCCVLCTATLNFSPSRWMTINLFWTQVFFTNLSSQKLHRAKDSPESCSIKLSFCLLTQRGKWGRECCFSPVCLQEREVKTSRLKNKKARLFSSRDKIILQNVTHVSDDFRFTALVAYVVNAASLMLSPFWWPYFGLQLVHQILAADRGKSKHWLWWV